MVDGAADTSHMTGDGRGDPVPVLGRALVIRTQDQASAVGGEPAVTTGGVAAGEVAEEDEIGCRRRQVSEARGTGLVRVPLLGVRLVGAVWHGGVVSQRRGRHPGPLKPRVVSGTDLQSVPAKASRIAVLEAFACLAPSGGRRPHRGSTGNEPESRQSRPLVIHAVQLGSLGGQLQRALPLTASERPGSNRGRIRCFPLTASARLRNPS